jgi:glycosyltransferase involved in cell wall biosynthesis
MVQDGVNGLLADVGDDDQLFLALSTLLANPTARATMGNASVGMVTSRYTWPAVVGRIRETFIAIGAPSIADGGHDCGR